MMLESDTADEINDLEGEILKEVDDNMSSRLEKNAIRTEGSEPDDKILEGRDSSDEEGGSNDHGRNRLKMYKKRKFVLNELLDTEKTYLQDLAQIVDGYMDLVKNGAIEKPSGLVGREMVVFGNVHQIHDWHSKTFLPELEKNLDVPRKLANTFIKYERKFDMYVKYCENKPKSEDLVYENLSYFEELRESLGEKFQLTDMLIKPVQRIMKYKLLFKDILKYTERAGDDVKEIQKALEVMCVIPKAANDMMNVSRLQGFNGKVTAQGRLLLQNNLLVAEVGSSKAAIKTDKMQFQNRRTFLFEQIIIFSEQPDKKKNSLLRPTYLYRNSIRVNKMSLTTDVADDAMAFILTSKTPESRTRFVCKAMDAASKKNWVTQINLIMEMQKDLLKALQSPIEYQNEGKNSSLSNLLESSTENKEPPKCTKPSKTKTRSFRDLFLRQSSVQHESHSRHTEHLSVASSTNLKIQTVDVAQATVEPKTSGVCTEGAKSKWSLLRKRTSKSTTPTNSPTTEDVQSLKDVDADTTPCANNTHVLSDTLKKSLHSSIDNLLSSKGVRDSKSSEGSSAMEGCRDSKCDGGIFKKENGEDASKMPKTAGVVWTNLKLLFKRPSITVSTANETTEVDGIALLDESHNSKECAMEAEDENTNPGAPALIESLKSTTAIEKSHVTFTCSFLSTYKQHESGMLAQTDLTTTVSKNANGKNEFESKNDDNTQITWLDPHNEIVCSSSERVLECRKSKDNQIECRLTLHNVNTSQSGLYKCLIRNPYGSACTEATLKISPEIKSKPKLKVNSALNEGLNAKFLCLASTLSLSASPSFQEKKKIHAQAEKDNFKWSQGFDEKFSEVSLLHQSKHLTTLKKYVDLKNPTGIVVGKFHSKFFKSKNDILNENLLTNSLDHPSLIRSLETFELQSGYITTYPYIKHGRLFDYIGSLMRQEYKEPSSFTDSMALHLSMQLFSGLEYLHNRNIAHLKINPENLLVEVTAAMPSLKVVDFSHSKQLTSNDSGYVHTFCGDAEFSAPEILQHIPVTLYADVWSAGVVLFTMLTGFSPFYKGDMQRTCQAVVDTSLHLDSIVDEASRRLLSSIFSMPPSQRPSASKCSEECRLSSLTLPPSTLPISPTLIQELLRRRSQL